MKIAVLSDIHSNWPALQAVDKDMSDKAVDLIFCLGDIIGYGAEPRECVQWVRKRAAVTVMGNHEKMLWDKAVAANGNVHAFVALQKNRELLSDTDLEFIKNLPMRIVPCSYDISLAHGSFFDAESFEYIQNDEEHKKELRVAFSSFTLIGHTHRPAIFCEFAGLEGDFIWGRPYVFLSKEKYLVNVGSVGQPRDGDCRACYAILEFGDRVSCTFRRVFYRIDKTVKAMKKVGLDGPLSERLFKGQ